MMNTVRRIWHRIFHRPKPEGQVVYLKMDATYTLGGE
jgi:hypothetical protein